MTARDEYGRPLPESICKNCGDAIHLVPEMHFGSAWFHIESRSMACYGVVAEPIEETEQTEDQP